MAIDAQPAAEKIKTLAVVRRPPGRPPGIKETKPRRTVNMALRIRALVGHKLDEMVQVLLDIANDKKGDPKHRIYAIRELLDRGWGKAPQFIEIRDATEHEAPSLDITKLTRDEQHAMLALIAKAQPTETEQNRIEARTRNSEPAATRFS